MYNNFRVIFHMKNNNLLITTAMLTSIFETSKKDTLDLMMPFVLEIIFENDGKELANNQYIKEQLNKKYSFFNFPNAILSVIINRLKKQQKIIQKDNEYIIIGKNIEEQIKIFSERKSIAKQESDNLISSICDYLKQHNIKNIDVGKTEQYFSLFLKRNGYSIFEGNQLNIKYDIKKDQINYFIGKFIVENFENKTDIFDKLKKIVDGFMIATALYVQVESSNNSKFKKLDCYFDAPFLLRILGYKTQYMNDNAIELKKLLEDSGANIKCFKHNYEEVEGILENYIRNYGKNLEKTLEGLDVENYTVSELQIMLDTLMDRFIELNINVVETPKYNEDEYDSVIDETKLLQMLKENYDKEVPEETLRRDVASASAIVRIRKNKIFKRIEDSKAIFVTTNYSIRYCVNSLLNIDETFQISPIVSDIDMTAITWLKTFNKSDSKNLPIMKLIENARSCMEPTPSVIKEFNRCIERMNNNPKIPLDSNSLGNLLTSIYFRKQLMEDIEGLDKNINEKQIVKTYEKTIDENQNLIVENENLKESNYRLNNKIFQNDKDLEEKKEKIIKSITLKSERNSKIIIEICKTLSLIIILILIIIIGNIIFEQDFQLYDKTPKSLILIIYSVISFIITIWPLRKAVLNFWNKRRIYLFEYIKKYQEKKLKNIGYDI